MKEYPTDLARKLQEPPIMESNEYYCMWSDLLGFGNILFENNWELDAEQQQEVYMRLQYAHNVFFKNTDHLSKGLVLNDGLVRVFNPHTSSVYDNKIFCISIFLRNIIFTHLGINEVEAQNGYPGARTVISAGMGIKYLVEDVKFNDLVFNWSKPEGQGMSKVAQTYGNPTLVYNPSEFQMNTAFSKAYLLESGGSKIGIAGPNLFVEKSFLDSIQKISISEGYKPVWKKENNRIEFIIPVDEKNLDKVVLGFVFEAPEIKPTIKNWNPTVYKVLEFFPNDELRSEFSFKLNDLDAWA